MYYYIVNVIRDSNNMSVSKSSSTSSCKKSAFVRVTEEPAGKGLRFRYECEGRSAGSIPGVSSTNDKKTFPTIQVIKI